MKLRVAFVLILLTQVFVSNGQEKKDILKTLGDAAIRGASDYITNKLANAANKPLNKTGKDGNPVNNYAILDKNLGALAQEMAAKLIKKKKLKIALADFTNTGYQAELTTNYIFDQIEMNLINEDKLQVMDRKNIKAILKEHEMESEGLLNENVARSSIAFIKVDGWLFGDITTFGSQIKVQLKVVDVSSSQILAVQTSNLIDINDLNNCDLCNGSGLSQSRSTCTTCKGTGGDKCSWCNGTGRWKNPLGDTTSSCERCNGKGKNYCAVCNGKGQMIVSNSCSKCHGSGKRN